MPVIKDTNSNDSNIINNRSRIIPDTRSDDFLDLNGITGTSGTSGSAGTSGTSGTAGAEGTSGTSGTAGGKYRKRKPKKKGKKTPPAPPPPPPQPPAPTNTSSTKDGIVSLGCNGIKLKRDIPNIGIAYGKISPVKDRKGKQETGTSGGESLKWEVLVGRGNNRGDTLENYIRKDDYDGKYVDKNFPYWKDKYANFVNMSLYELKRTLWGSGQPTGAFVVSGNYYGAKPDQYITGFPAISIVNGRVKMEYGSSFVDQQTRKPKPGVTISIPGGYLAIYNNKVSTSNSSAKDYPFVGIVTSKSSNVKTFFAGAGNGAPKNIAKCILNYFQSEGTIVERCIIGDGGGSTCFVVDGKNIKGGKRPFPVIVYWS